VKLIVCESPEQIRAAQRLRYEVFCVEKGWIEESECTAGVEADEFDESAVHFLVMDNDGETLLGTSRLILGGCQRLPAAEFIDLEALGLDVSTVVEVSRMASRKVSRSQSLSVFLAMTQVMWEWSMAHGKKAWVSVADVPVFALMKRVGMPIIAEGERVGYLGSLCVPSCVDMLGTGSVLASRGFSAEHV